MNQNPNMGNQGIFPQQQPNVNFNQAPYNMPEMNDLVKYRMVYPEIYYKCQPFVMMACDQMDAFSSEMLTQDMIEKMSDAIYDDVCRMYPDVAEYVKCEPKGNAAPTQGPLTFDPDMYGRRFRRRGIFRDFLEFLLYSELFRRRRRFY